MEVRGQAESEGHLNSIDSDILDSVSYCNIDSEDEEDEEDDELFMSCMANDRTVATSAGEPEQGRKRRPSKKQRRKRRNQYKEMYLDDLYNLGNLFDATDDISEVFGDVLATGPDVRIQNRVPTLVELCLKVNRRKQRQDSEKGKNSSTNTPIKQRTELPYGMKKLISHWSWSQKHLENQLSFFLNKVLPLVEGKIEHNEHIYHHKTDRKCTVFPKRSVWVNLPYAPLKSMFENADYGSEKTPSFLFAISAHFHGELDNFDYSNYYHYDNVTLNNAMWG